MIAELSKKCGKTGFLSLVSVQLNLALSTEGAQTKIYFKAHAAHTAPCSTSLVPRRIKFSVLEVIPMSSTTAVQTIEALRKLFFGSSLSGVPHTTPPPMG